MDSLMVEYNNVQNQILYAYHEASVKLGISDAEFDILYVLNSEGSGCLQSALYKKTGASKSTINTCLHKMMERGLIELKASGGRNTAVYLTEKGERHSEQTVARIIEIENEIFSSLTSNEKKQLVEINKKYFFMFKEKLKSL